NAVLARWGGATGLLAARQTAAGQGTALHQLVVGQPADLGLLWAADQGRATGRPPARCARYAGRRLVAAHGDAQAAANQTGAHWMDRHGVNVGMGLKLPVVYAQAHPEQPQLNQALRTGWHDIMTLHGLPAGMFSADEDLHGNLPTQGTELCAVVETMFSLEQAAGMTGD
nr:hypothetical protein [Tanacetum cinerariifolium]